MAVNKFAIFFYVDYYFACS